MRDIFPTRRTDEPTTQDGTPLAGWPVATTAEEAAALQTALGQLQTALDAVVRERDAALAEVERLRARPLQWPPPIGAGCVCPPGANRSCANSFCPRRDPPGVTCESMR